MIERMRADSARLGRQRVRDHEEAMARERRLERDNATLMNALARRIDQNQVIDKAITIQQAQGTRNQETPVNPVTPVTPATRARGERYMSVLISSRKECRMKVRHCYLFMCSGMHKRKQQTWRRC
ncbi:hypothetical protein ACLB2K_050968 [Fragaria x ananassa]